MKLTPSNNSQNRSKAIQVKTLTAKNSQLKLKDKPTGAITTITMASHTACIPFSALSNFDFIFSYKIKIIY